MSRPEAGDMSIVKEETEEDSVDDSEEDANAPAVNLTQATMATLLRLKKDDLIALCASHGLEAGSLKKDFAQALLDWVCSAFCLSSVSQ